MFTDESQAEESQSEATMLVLSRKVGERILIGENIAVTVVHVGPGMVRLGVEAPKQISIVREEIKEQLKGDVPSPRAIAPR